MAPGKINPTTLKKIREGGGFPVPEEALVTSILISLPGRATLSEVQASMRMCEENGWAVSTTNPVTGEVVWKLTTDGDLALKELRI